MNRPLIEYAENFGSYPIGDQYIAMLMGNITSVGPIQYDYILEVYDLAAEEPCFIVASEINKDTTKKRKGSHILCVFDEKGHKKLTTSDDWGNMKLFQNKAMEMALERFEGK